MKDNEKAASTVPSGVPSPALPAEGTWHWWSGSSDEWYTNGPFVTREEAVHALDGYGGHVIEAQRGAVHFDASSLIESQYFENDDYFTGEHGEPERLGDCVTADAELQALLNQWLNKWGHTFVPPELFLRSRNSEEIHSDV